MTMQSSPLPQGHGHKVYAIEHGTVIDHIPAKKALAIVTVLQLASKEHVITIGLNFDSKKNEHKDVIKIEKRELTPEEANVIAIFAPGATINIIRDFVVAEKFTVTVPKSITRLIVCPNPMCITNHEPMNTLFHISHVDSLPLSFRCEYCEKQFTQEELQDFRY
jgi:aspartate carbamoyltransferase regulatory subunit